MNRATEIALLAQICDLSRSGVAFLDDDVGSSDVRRYIDPQRLITERDRLFRSLPMIAAHSSELAQSGAFIRRQMANLPVLLTRDADGGVHAFLNVCRHRGAQLVSDEQGCRHRFSCPYHAWTWTNTGELVGVPHDVQGFPNLNHAHMGLKRLPCVERYGWLWVVADPSVAELPHIEAFLSGLAPDFEWLRCGDYRIAQCDSQVWDANWKLLVEGGIESYHFRVAHRQTIARYFHDNLSTYQFFDGHFRSVLPRTSTATLTDVPVDQWRLRDHANILYALAPSCQLLVQSDHVVWIRAEPIDAARTELTVTTLVPSDSDHDPAHWAKNHELTVRTLQEDFELAAGIQAGLASGANDYLNFGRFEGALSLFNRWVDQRINESL